MVAAGRKGGGWQEVAVPHPLSHDRKSNAEVFDCGNAPMGAFLCARLIWTIRCVPKSGGSSSSGRARPSPVNNGPSCRSLQRPWRVQKHRTRL